MFPASVGWRCVAWSGGGVSLLGFMDERWGWGVTGGAEDEVVDVCIVFSSVRS